MKKLIAAAVFSLSSLCFAGDAAKLTHIGFSSDGKSYAFMESGIQDGSGFAYADIKFLDVVNNKYAAPAVSSMTTEEDTIGNLLDTELDAIKKADATLKSLKISPFIKGDVLLSRKLTDLDARDLKEVNFSNGPIIGGLVAPKYKLKLTQTSVKVGPEAACLLEGEAKKLKLELINIQTNKKTILQEDKKLPASRRCAHNYAIEDVVVINPDQMSELASNVVVLVRIYSYGFEGEDVRYMAISGRLNVE